LKEFREGLPSDLRNLKYEERLKAWEITSLEKRRERADSIQMYKCINELNVINWHKAIRFATLPEEGTALRACKNTNSKYIYQRENFKSKAVNDHCHFVTVRHHFFTNRVAETWNKIPDNVIIGN